MSFSLHQIFFKLFFFVCLNSYTFADMKNIWTFVKADSVFRELLPEIKNHKNKIRGKNGRGNPVDFSDAEKKKINKAIEKAIKDHKL